LDIQTYFANSIPRLIDFYESGVPAQPPDAI
jgi:hypothetical protein